MAQLKSSLLFIGTHEKSAEELGADTALSIQEIEDHLRANSYAVLVLVITSDVLQSLESISHLIEEHQDGAQIVLAYDDLPVQQLQKVTNRLKPFKVLSKGDPQLFQQTIQSALEQYSLFAQNSQLLELISSQNEKLKKLSLELESRVEKRQKYLANAKEKLSASNTKVEALHKALVAIHQADTVRDLETLLHHALAGGFSLSWVRILFDVEDFLKEQEELAKFEVFSVPLVQDGAHIGQIYFARDKSFAYKKEDHNFLIQVADAASLALDRLTHLEQAKTIKRQWESTFDAITAPLSLVSKDHHILRCNKSFAKQAGQPITSIIGKKCFETLFQRNEPCPQCHLGAPFRLAPQKTGQQRSMTFEVSSQELHLPVTQQKTYAVVYHDISDQLRWERQLIESAKMAEIGTIGSSIAHELNNPLGGMLSFLQLVRSGLEGDEFFYDDIIEMEKGAQSCKEIVQNLLSFSRSPNLDRQELSSLREVLEKAIKLTELQTRSKGIEISLALPDDSTVVHGQKGLLVQAFRHILQDISQSLADHLTKEPHAEGCIDLKTFSDEASIGVELDGKLPGPQKKLNIESQSELSLSITNQIIVEHSGTLEVFSQGERKSLFRVTFPRPET